MGSYMVMGVSQNGWFTMEMPFRNGWKLGVPPFMETTIWFFGLMKFLWPFQWEKNLDLRSILLSGGITEFDVWWSREPQNLRVYQWPVDQSAMLPCKLSRKKIRFCIGRWSFQHDFFWQMWAGGLNGFDGFIQNLCKKNHLVGGGEGFRPGKYAKIQGGMCFPTPRVGWCVRKPSQGSGSSTNLSNIHQLQFHV